MSKEKVFYRDDEITITNSRAVFGSTTYSVANITSVSMETRVGSMPASSCVAALLAVSSLVCFSGSVLMALSALLTVDVAPGGAVIGLLMWGPIAGVFFVGMIGGYLLYRKLSKEKSPEKYVVEIRTASGEVGAVSVLTSEDRSRVDEVVQALNRAIADE